MVKNMGSIDRTVRLILGLVFIVVAILQGAWFWILGALGLVFLATSAVSSCPLYMPFGISTRKKSSE